MFSLYPRKFISGDAANFGPLRSECRHPPNAAFARERGDARAFARKEMNLLGICRRPCVCVCVGVCADNEMVLKFARIAIFRVRARSAIAAHSRRPTSRTTGSVDFTESHVREAGEPGEKTEHLRLLITSRRLRARATGTASSTGRSRLNKRLTRGSTVAYTRPLIRIRVYARESAAN